MNFVNDVTIKLVRVRVCVILATVAVSFTRMGQILCLHFQRDLEYDSIKLLYSTFPPVTIGTLVFIPASHDVGHLAQVGNLVPLDLNIHEMNV